MRAAGSPVTMLRWLGLLATGTGVFVVSMVVNFRVPVLSELGDDLAMGVTQLGILTACFAFGRLLADVPAGRLVDRTGIRPAFVLVGVLVAAGSGILAVSQNRWHAWAAAGVLGVASALSSVAGMTHFSARSTRARRGLMMAGFTAALLGGQAVGPTVGGVIADVGHWRTPMWLGAGLGLVVVAVVASARRDRDPPDGNVIGSRAPEAVAPDEPARPEFDRARRLYLASVPFSLAFAISALPLTVIPIIGAESLGLTSTSIGLALGVGGTARVVGNFAAGALSDRYGRKVLLVPGLAVQALGVGLLALEGRVWAWLACIVVMSLSSYGISTASAMLGDRTSTQRAGRRFAAFRLSGDLGLLLGGASTAALYAMGGQGVAILPTVALLLASSVTVAFLVPETHRTLRSGYVVG